MRHIYIFLLVMLFSAFANAQYIYTDFDGNQNETFSGWPNAPTVVVNPDQSGINTSANVGQWVRSTEQWAHAYIILSDKINFATGNTFKMKAWSPIACNFLFKLEDKTNGGIFIEKVQAISTPNQWVELTFDFTGAASGTYDKIVIFMDFATTTDNTFYFDDVEGPSYGSGTGPTGAHIYNDFDANQNNVFSGWPNAPESIINPDPSGLNTSANVGKWIRTTETWAHMYTVLDGKVNFATGDKFYLKVWSPITCNVLFKLEDQANGATFVEVSQPVAVANEWVQLTFNFAGAQSGLYDKVVIFLDFMGSADNTFFFDDIQGPEYSTGPGPWTPYIYTDFDANQNVTFTGWPNAPELIANPDPTGLNTSANVGKWMRTTETWAHMSTVLDGKVNFSTGDKFFLKVWSPITCNVLFKLEDQANGAIFKEVSQPVATANQWVELTFDFFGSQSDLYDKVVIFLDFMGSADNTFYFDDVAGPQWGGGGTGTQVTLPVTFEDETVNYALTDFGGNASEIVVDPTNANNMVAKSIKTATAELWAGTTVGGTTGFPTPIPFEAGSTTMSVKIWSPTSGTPMRLKVEAASDPTISVETEAVTTVANDWQTLVFDFSNEATGTAPLDLSKSYNKASIFFNFGTTGAQAGEQTYYWDDMEFTGTGPVVKPLAASDVQENFENDGYSTIPEWKFQDPDLNALPVIVDPLNAENHVADYIRSGNFEWTNAQFILNHRMDLSERNKFQLKVLFPSSNNYTGNLTPTAAMKLQNSLLGGNAWTTQTEIKLTIEQFDAWVTLQFDFSAITDSVNYDQIVIQFGGEGHFVAGQFHFDDLKLLEAGASVNDQQINTFDLYPNPVSEMFVIGGVEGATAVKVYNIQGQLVISETGNISILNVSQLNRGVYQVVVENKKGERFFAKMLKI